jgi:hypothetical protein
MWAGSWPIGQSVKRTELASFIDKDSSRVENGFMRTQHSISLHLVTAISLVTLLGLFSNSEETAAKDFNPDNPLNEPAPVYWCPSKTPDQQISTKQGSGCQPLYNQQAEVSFRESARQQGYDLPDRDPIKIVELQNAASKFSDRYRTFLSCCLTASDAPIEIVDLIDEANHILKAVQQKGIFNSTGFGTGSGVDGLGGGPGQSPKLGTFARQFTLSEIVGTVARARDDLSSLVTRLGKLNESKQTLGSADYEASGRERLHIQEEEDAIRREFKSKKPAASAPTGMEIQDTTLRSRIGGDIEDTKLNPNFGADINYSVSPYSTVGESLRPRRGDDVQDSNLPHRPGTDLQDTTIPNSTGFEIDKSQNPDGSSTIPRRGVGPSIGDSDLNSKRR